MFACWRRSHVRVLNSSCYTVSAKNEHLHLTPLLSILRSTILVRHSRRYVHGLLYQHPISSYCFWQLPLRGETYSASLLLRNITKNSCKICQAEDIHAIVSARCGLNTTTFATRGRARSRPAKNSFIIWSISLDTSRVYSISPQVSQIRAGTSLMTMISSSTLANYACPHASSLFRSSNQGQ